MSRNVDRVPLREINNQSQGKPGGKVPMLSGPAKSPKHNPVKSGGINRPTRPYGA